MTLILKKGLRLRRSGPSSWLITGTQKLDLNAAAYIAAAYISAVEAADGQALETGVRDAINAFVLGCEADGIKTCCILAGARTLAGALMPLVGAAPTNVGFTSSNYNRKTGLLRNSTQYLNSNRDNSADPQNSSHLALYSAVQWPEQNGFYFAGMGTNNPGSTCLRSITGVIRGNIRHGTTSQISFTRNSGFLGMARFNSVEFQMRVDGTTSTLSAVSTTPLLGPISIFTDSSVATSGVANTRLAFYSIGESLDLALLDARVTALVNALAVAIP
jgi:hypothetical protein